MPRRSARTTTIPDSPPQTSAQPPVDPIHESLSILRRQWKWAAFCQFFITFAHLFAMEEVNVTDIENDLVQATNVVLPRIMARLLYTLSYDRRVSVDNFQTALRRQYLKRNPEANPIGPEPERSSPEPLDSVTDVPAAVEDSTSLLMDSDVPSPQGESFDKATSRDTSAHPEKHRYEPDTEESHNYEETSRDWRELPMLARLDSMHLLTEWQFQNPTRIRQLMRSDDEHASWRIEPIGYDSKHSAYWHIGDRLWIQRALPKPQKSLKRKRPGAARANGSSKAKQPAKRQRTHAVRDQPNEPPATISTGERGRAAKTKAKLKLDAQAKELAELNRQAASQKATEPPGMKRRSASGVPKSRPPLSRPMGTRLSARLRGLQDEEWQPIPEDWLNKNDQVGHHSKTADKTGLESDDDSISDLTELSDEGREQSCSPGESKPEPPSSSEKRPPEMDTDNTPNVPHDFVEWETICVTLEDWEHIAEKFKKASYYLEKALCKKLTTEIVPSVIEKLREIEKQRRLEEALSHRKRSSRIAIKESEKEEARLAAKKLAEENEKMSRMRRLEARRQKEEEERIKRENAREQRRKEREAREAARQTSPVTPSVGSVKEDHQTPEVDAPTKPSYSRQGKRRPPNGHTNGAKSGTRTPIGDDWEVDCEICLRRGVNLDDGKPMMSCGVCSKWQHIACHDQEDQRLGRSKRDWDVVEFVCRKCQTRNGRSPQVARSFPQSTVYGPSLPVNIVPQNSYYRAPSFIPVSQPQYPTDQRTQYGTPFNGASPYTHGQVSDLRSSTLQSTPETHPRTTIAFSHYQPHDRVFTPVSKAHPPYYYGNTQPYGQVYSQSYRYADQRSMPQPSFPQGNTVPAPWNAPVSANGHGLPRAPAGTSQSGNVIQLAERAATSAATPTPDTQWHVNHPQASASAHHPNGTQFRYHSTPYQSGS